MSDQFLSIPDQMIGATLFPQEAVDWLAFGPPEQGARSSLSLDDQILCAHTAAGALLMAMWGGNLPAYVRSPSLGSWYQVPALYWGRQTSESMHSAMQRPEIPDRLPGVPQPLDPRYGIDVGSYPHRLPTDDLVGQIVAFRTAEVERHCVIAKPVCQWKLKKAEGKLWSLYEAVAWIATGDDDFARQQAEFYERHPSPKEAGAVTWLTLQQALEARDPGARLMSLEDSRRSLRAACEAGRVSATGVIKIKDDPLTCSDRLGIPATDFAGVELWPGKGGSLHRIIHGRGETARWFELRFDGDEVRQLHQPPTPHVDEDPLESASGQADRNRRPPLGTARLREWIVVMNRDGRSQTDIAKGAASAFPDFQVPGRPTIRQIDAEVRAELGLPPREPGKPRQWQRP